MRFTFREECHADAETFFAALGDRAENVLCELPEDIRLDARFSFDTPLSLTELLSVLADLTDCDVIEDTLQPEREFTGQRLYRAEARRAREEAA